LKVKMLAFFLGFFFLPPLPFVLLAEIVHLKNGNAMETKILKEDEEFVTVQAPGGKVKIQKNEIQTIEREPAADLSSIRGK